MNNCNFEAEDGVLFGTDDKRLIAYPVAKTDMSYRVLERIEIIGKFAFAASEYLNYVYLPDTVTEL